MEQGKNVSAPESPPVDFPGVCERIRAALEPARSHAISLHDEKGDILYLSEGSMGPDEHNAVHGALEAFADPTAAPVASFDLGDSRHAVLVRIINPRRIMIGLAMIIMDSRVVSRGAIKLMTPQLQRALLEFAAMRPAAAVPATEAAKTALSLAPSPAGTSNRSTAAPQPAPRTALTIAPASAGTSNRAPGPQPAVKAALSIAPSTAGMSNRAAPVAQPAARAAAVRPAPTQPPESRRAPAVPPEVDRLHAAMRKSPIALHVQRLVPLSKGTQLKRYEVLLRLKADNASGVAPHAMLKAAVEKGLGSMIDRRVMTELISWLVKHPAVWQSNQAMFSVNLTSTALHDEHFIKFVELCLAKSSLPKGVLAFEIDTSAALNREAKVSEIAAAMHRLGCPLVLDDFALRTECFALLRLPGVRYVKLAPQITAKMRTDKLAQASITAVVQMARVLGMHTVAKRTESDAEQEWLTALGVDFVQSHAMSPPVALESLERPAA